MHSIRCKKKKERISVRSRLAKSLLNVKSFFFFLHPFYFEGAWSAVQNETTTLFGSPTQTAFRLNEIPRSSNQDPSYNRAILLVVFKLASSHLL